MSITETHDERATSIEMASALTLSVSSLHDHNDALVAENDYCCPGRHLPQWLRRTRAPAAGAGETGAPARCGHAQG